ncbi:MAG: hypothetical protein KJP02_11695 [Octadecabacter sp.]|nr:hypothetical protein [Octadecabacter sp.]
MAEHFWGIEVASGQDVLDLALVLRGVKALAAGAAFVLAMIVWLPPFAGFLTGAVAAKGLVCIILLVTGLVMARAASRGTRVYVQLDTKAGEIREVAYTVFGKVNVLARYGIDSVTGVSVQRSDKLADAAQILILIDGVGAIRAGVGSVFCVKQLQNRMLVELGVQRGNARPAIWVGPLAG